MKLKSLYLVLFMLCMSTAIFAQEKYEQAVIVQSGNTSSADIRVSIEGQEFKKTKAKMSEFLDYTPILKEVATMRNDGWEVWNSERNAANEIAYFLRRKIK